jgi:hypothetical protein
LVALPREAWILVVGDGGGGAVRGIWVPVGKPCPVRREMTKRMSG